MGSADYKTREFRDRVVSAIRYAQKTSVSHRRPVCVSFTASTVTLQMDTNRAGACASALLVPGTASNTMSSPDASKAYFTSASDLSVLNFDSQGRSADRTLSIPGESDIIVVGATGYVN
jgi:MSHA pilin protein MshC